MRTELVEQIRRDVVMKNATSMAQRLLAEAASIEDADQKNWSLLGTSGATVGGGAVEKELDQNRANTARAQAYRMYYDSPYVRGIVRTLSKFVFGRGVTIELMEENESKWQKATDYLEEWKAQNHWNLAIKELAVRSFRDGENFWYNRKMGDKNYPRLEFLEPDEIRSKNDKFPHGIEMMPNDPTTAKFYHVAKGPDKEIKLPGKDVVHIKMCVDRNVRRGRTILEPIFKHLKLHDDWLDTRMVLNRVRSAVAIVRTVEGKQVQGQVIRQANADTRPNKQNKQRAFKSGTILTAGPGVKYDMLSANLGASDAAQDGRNILLAIAVGVGFPEMFLTSDYSNANFASTAVAQNPFVKEFEDWQDFFDVYLQDEFRRVLELGIEAGLVDEGIDLKMKLTFPPLIHKDFVQQVTALGQLFMNEVISKRTYAAEAGFDYEKEKELRDEEAETDPTLDTGGEGDEDEENGDDDFNFESKKVVNENVLEQVRRSLRRTLQDDHPDWTEDQLDEAVDEGAADYKRLIEASTQVKSHIRKSKKGKVSNVKQHGREYREFKNLDEFRQDDESKETTKFFKLKGLTSSEKSTIEDYTGEGNEFVNTFLRHGRLEGDYDEDEPLPVKPVEPIKPNKKDFDLTTKSGKNKYEKAKEKYYYKKDDYDDALSTYKLDMEDRDDSGDDNKKYVQKMIKNMDSVTGKGRVNGDIIAYRGLGRGGHIKEFRKLKTGREFLDKGFVSTSLDKATAKQFSTSNYMRIRIPRGTRAAYIDRYSSSNGEYELVLPRGSTFKIDKVAWKGSRMIVEASYKGVSKSARKVSFKEAVERAKYHKFVWNDGDLIFVDNEDVEDQQEEVTYDSIADQIREAATALLEKEVTVKAHTRKDSKTGKDEQVDAHTRKVEDRTTLTREELEDIIANGKPSDIRSLESMGDREGYSSTYVISLTKNGKTVNAVFKPEAGEDPGNIAQTGGKQSKREAAVSETGKLLGLQDYVPVSSLRSVKDKSLPKGGGKGAVIEYMNEGLKVGANRALRNSKSFDFNFGEAYDKHQKTVGKFAAFDYVIGSRDRHAENWKTDKKGRFALIDNGQTFRNKQTKSIRSNFYMYAKTKKLSIKDSIGSSWDDAWPGIKKIMSKYGIAGKGQKYVKERYDELMSAKNSGKSFSDLSINARN